VDLQEWVEVTVFSSRAALAPCKRLHHRVRIIVRSFFLSIVLLDFAGTVSVLGNRGPEQSDSKDKPSQAAVFSRPAIGTIRPF